jgi:hypothetical protein
MQQMSNSEAKDCDNVMVNDACNTELFVGGTIIGVALMA